MRDQDADRVFPKRAEFYVQLSRRKEAEGDLSAAFQNMQKARTEDGGANETFFLEELERLQQRIAPVDPEVKAALVKLFCEAALAEENIEAYEAAENAAEDLAKRLAAGDPAAAAELKELAGKNGVKMGLPISVIEANRKAAGAMVPKAAEVIPSGGKTADEYGIDETAFEEIDADPEYDAVAKIIHAYYRQEKEIILSDPQLISDVVGAGGSAEETAALFVLRDFPSRFVSPQLMQEASAGELSGLIDAVSRNLADRGPFFGDAAAALVGMCDNLSCQEDDAKWYHDQELKYLELAHSAGAIKGRHYKKLRDFLLNNPPV